MSENISELEKLIKCNLSIIENQSSSSMSQDGNFQQTLNNLIDLVNKTIVASKHCEKFVKEQNEEIKGFLLVNTNLVCEVEHYQIFGATNKVYNIFQDYFSKSLDYLLNFILNFMPLIDIIKQQIKMIIEQK
ncbi:10123_t:CDS:1, partial [Dentiscutata heterogama]